MARKTFRSPGGTLSLYDLGPGFFDVDAGITPEQFGAVGDGSTDNGTALDLWLQELRSTGRLGILPPKTYYAGTTTLNMGGCMIIGSGRSGGSLDWSGKHSIITSDANPVVTFLAHANDVYYGRYTYLHNFALRGAGGAVPTVDLYDWLDYPYQIGIQLGRRLTSIPRDDTQPAGTPFGWVADLVVQDMGGWAVYGYEAHGDSYIGRFGFRGCGGKAAYSESDDSAGGGIFLDGSSVDTIIEKVHGFSAGHTDANWDNRGCAFRLGSDKAQVEALGSKFLVPGQIYLNEAHFEGFPSMQIRGCKNFHSNMINFNGGGANPQIQLGWAGNPSGTLFGALDYLRVARDEVVEIAQGVELDLRLVQGAPAFGPATVKYWGDAKVNLVQDGQGSSRDGESLWELEPQFDPATQPGGSGLTDDDMVLPYVNTGSRPGGPEGNLLPPFSASDGASSVTDWTLEEDGPGSSLIADRWKVTLAGPRTVQYTATGLPAGALLSFYTEIQVEGALNSVGLGNITFTVQDGTPLIIVKRALGTGSNNELFYRRQFQFLVPNDGEVRMRFRNGNPDGVTFKAPVLALGSFLPPYYGQPAAWIARGEVISTV